MMILRITPVIGKSSLWGVSVEKIPQCLERCRVDDFWKIWMDSLDFAICSDEKGCSVPARGASFFSVMSDFCFDNVSGDFGPERVFSGYGCLLKKTGDLSVTVSTTAVEIDVP